MERTGSVGARPPAGHRVTKLNVTLSTLKRASNAEEEIQLKNLVNDFQEAVATDEQVRSDIFGTDTDYHIELTPGTPEVGQHAKGGRVHIHFSIKANHSGTWHVNDIQTRMRDVFIKYALARGIVLKGAYAHVELGNAYYENYLAKNGDPSHKHNVTGKRSAGYVRMLKKQMHDATK